MATQGSKAGSGAQAPGGDSPVTTDDLTAAGTVQDDADKSDDVAQDRTLYMGDEEKSAEDAQREQEEQAAKDEEERKERMNYASSVQDRSAQGDVPFIESEEDWYHTNRLIADGHAVVHAIQQGIETQNYLVLTPEGESAVQAHNAQAD